MADSQQKLAVQTPIQFTGNTKEYFGIWIVNLMLSIVTLGIYSAWAKVRDKKYFYHNTFIDDVAFGYHAKPKAILIGRLIAFGLFIAFQLVSQVSLGLSFLLGIAFSFAIPWIFIRGLRFNAVNSSHRGLRFDFNGRYKDAVKMLLLYPVLYMITFGLAYPFVAQRVRQFLVSKHRFGMTHFSMGASVNDYYKVYLKLFGVGLALSVLMTGIATRFDSVSDHQEKSKAVNTQTLNSSTVSLSSAYSLTPATQTGYLKVKNAQADLKHLSPEERAEIEAYIDDTVEKEGANADQANKDSTSAVIKQLLKDLFSGGILSSIIPLLLYGAFMLSVMAYVKVRIGNLVWNNTTLDHIHFISTQRVRDIWWLYFSNMLALILTLGLATPWAKIRLARYRLNHLAIAGETNWDQFVGEKKASAQALGEEMADMFDVDISFG